MLSFPADVCLGVCVCFRLWYSVQIMAEKWHRSVNKRLILNLIKSYLSTVNSLATFVQLAGTTAKRKQKASWSDWLLVLFLSGQLPKGEKNHPKQGVRNTYERKVCCLRPCRRVPKNTPANQFNRPDEKAKEDKKTSRNVCTKQLAENVCEPCRFVVRAAVSSQKRPKAFRDGLPKMLNWSCYRGKGGCFSGSQFHPWLWLFFRPTSASRADRWDADNFPVRAFSLECLCKWSYSCCRVHVPAASSGRLKLW